MLFNYLSEEEKQEVVHLEEAFKTASTIEEAEFFYDQYRSYMNQAKKRYLKAKFGQYNMTLNDKLTDDEKELIKEYETSMHRAWTNKGVNRYYDQILTILNKAQKR